MILNLVVTFLNLVIFLSLLAVVGTTELKPGAVLSSIFVMVVNVMSVICVWR